VSTVRRWLRRAGSEHAQWLYQQGVRHALPVNQELIDRPAGLALLAAALDILAGAALAYRRILGQAEPVWSWIGFFSRGRLLAPPPPPLRS